MDEEQIPWWKLFRSREIKAFGGSMEAWVKAGEILHSYPFAQEMSLREMAKHGHLRCKHYEQMAECMRCAPALDSLDSSVWHEKQVDGPTE